MDITVHMIQNTHTGYMIQDKKIKDIGYRIHTIQEIQETGYGIQRFRIQDTR